MKYPTLVKTFLNSSPTLWHLHKSTLKWSLIWGDTNPQSRLINKLMKTPSNQPFLTGFSWYVWVTLLSKSSKLPNSQNKQFKCCSLIIMDFLCKTLKPLSLIRQSNLLKWKSSSKRRSSYQSRLFQKNLDNIFHMFKNIWKIIIWQSFMQARNISEFSKISNLKSSTKMQLFSLLKYQKSPNQKLPNFTTQRTLELVSMQFRRNL